MQPCISIIIPVYNVAHYVERCIESVNNQTFEGVYETILVDDCGSDNSISIVQGMLSKADNERKTIIHHEKNRGLSAARNTGLKEARGEYVYFLDSDDLITPDCFENLWLLAHQYPNAEMIVGQYDEFKEGESFYEARWKQVGGIYEGDVIGAYLDKRIPAIACNKLIKRDFLVKNNLFFEEGLIHEDYLWSFQCACLLKKVVVSDSVTYHYLQRSNSIMSGNDFVKHQVYYAKGNALQTKFVFEHGLQNDIRIFRYIDQYRRNILGDLKGRSATKETEKVLSILKQLPYWSIWDLFQIGATEKEILRRIVKPNWY